jgi:hypothetical protein
MQGYTVVTSDDCKVGHVVGEVGDNLIVEHGTILKSRHPLPRAFAHVDEAERVVRTTVTKSVIEDAPKIHGDGSDLDALAVARHYGLAAGEVAPETLGYGDVDPDDPAYGVEADRAASGMPMPEQQRATAREHMRSGSGQSAPPSPGLLGSRNPENDR